jgi:PadR family transcriptional regulator PadR
MFLAKYFVILCILFYICNMNKEFIDKWQSQVKKGTLSFVVLLVLKENELYGYELIEKIKALTNIEIAEGTLYPLLNRLKTDNLLESKWIEQETGIPRKYYFLTENGKQTLEEMKIQWSDLQNGINKII